MPWGVVAGAVIGAASDQYANSQARGDAKKRNARDAWIGDAQHDLVNRSQAIADRPYVGYDGPRVAGPSQNEQMATTMARNASNFNDSRGYLDKAGATIDGVQNWSTETLNKYMNPYIDSVVDNTLKRENTAYQQRRNQLNSQSASIGAFGGDRATLLEAAETGQHLQNVGDITASGYSDAYKTALSAWQADSQLKLASADAYRAVGGDISRLNSSQITDLLRTGQADTLMRQMQLDVDYNDFLEERDWDVNNLEPLFRAVGQASGTPNQEKVPRDTTATNLAGMASTLVGYFGGRGGGGSAGGVGAGGGTAAPVAGYGGSGMGDYFGGGNSGVMLG